MWTRVGASRGPEMRDSAQNALSPPPCSILFVPCIASNAPSSTLMLFALSISPARPSLALGPPLHLKFSGREHLDRLCLVGHATSAHHSKCLLFQVARILYGPFQVKHMSLLGKTLIVHRVDQALYPNVPSVYFHLILPSTVSSFTLTFSHQTFLHLSRPRQPCARCITLWR